MQSEAALILLACAVAVSSVSLLINAIASVRICRSVRKLQEEVSPLIPMAQSTLVQAQTTLVQAASQLQGASEQASRLMEAIQTQVDGIDQARKEVAAQLRIQGERLELVLEDILSRTQEVVGVVHGTVLRPVREVSGMVAGVKAALQALLMSRRPTVDRATNDDDMFI